MHTTAELNGTTRAINSSLSLEPCIPNVTEDMLQARHVFWDNRLNIPRRKLICYHCTDQLVCLQQAAPIHWQAMGQLKCPIPKKSTAKITTNILRRHIPLIQGQWSQPRLDEWRRNQLATASPWIMDACRGHSSRSAQHDKWASKTQPQERGSNGNFFKNNFHYRGTPDSQKILWWAWHESSYLR